MESLVVHGHAGSAGVARCRREQRQRERQLVPGDRKLRTGDSRDSEGHVAFYTDRVQVLVETQ
jgi:hypothetical protein